MNPSGNARRLRRQQTKEERQLRHALRAGHFAGFKFRRQHPLGPYFFDFYCAAAKLTVELDGFLHGFPRQMELDRARKEFLEREGIEELRFWNHQWRNNREGVLLDIWHAVHRRTGIVKVMRKTENQRYVPPDPRQLTDRPPRPV